MAEIQGLKPRQRRAIAALLSSRNVQDAAQAVRVGERTLYRWLADDADFRKALTIAESALIDDTTRRLISGATAALDALAGLITSAESESVKKAAASDWLAHLIKLRELRDIEQRLADLEAAVYGEDIKPN
jgi:hypothetical protein